jgi:hypothetical protein
MTRHRLDERRGFGGEVSTSTVDVSSSSAEVDALAHTPLSPP